MAPRRSFDPQFTFQYSAPLDTSGRPTRIVYRSPSAPYRVRKVRPSITAIYKNTPKPNDRRRQSVRNCTPDRDPTPATSSRRYDRTPVPATPSPSPTPPPSPVLPPTTPVHHVRSSSRPGTPDCHLESMSSASRKGTVSDPTHRSGAVITRSASCSSMRDNVASASRGKVSPIHKRPPPPGRSVTLWTRFGIKNGSPTFVRRGRTSSSTDCDCVTAYYESFSLDEIRSLPDLANDPELEEGDVYINTIYDSGVPQMWIWSKDGGKVAFWKVAKEGDIREDGRRLSITPKLGLPSWVKPEWCMRQMLKQQKGKQVANRE